MFYTQTSIRHYFSGKVLGYLPADPTTLPRFPTEIWERILDELDSGVDGHIRRKVFSACCLVCQSWLLRSRYHLYKQVIIRSKEQAKEVSKLLHSIPALCARVENLNIRGNSDGKKDVAWIGLVGFHLGPKLSALEIIEIQDVDFSLTRLDFYQFWGAFSRAWKPGVRRKLGLWFCTVSHLNQLVRLAFVTKVAEISTWKLKSPGERSGADPPIPVLPSGIFNPLSGLLIHAESSDLVLPIPWHTLARQCSSLSSVEISSWNIAPDLSFPEDRLFLVSIFDMFRCMQRHNATSNVTLTSSTLPRIVARTRPCDRIPSDDADNIPLATRPRLCRELTLYHDFSDPIKLSTQVLACFEDAMGPGANNVNRGFHRIEITHPYFYDPIPDLCQPLDAILSRLHVTSPDVHVVVKEGGSRPREECVLPWAREHFPLFTQALPNAFCDLEAGRPCESHSQPSRKQGARSGLEGVGTREGAGAALESSAGTAGQQVIQAEQARQQERTIRRSGLKSVLRKVAGLSWVARKLWDGTSRGNKATTWSSFSGDAGPSRSSRAQTGQFSRT